MRKYMTEDPEWVSYYKGFSSNLYIEKAGYFDERPTIHTSVTQLIALVAIPLLTFYSLWFLLLLPFLLFGYGILYIHLPIKTGIQDCESAAWGFNYHNNTAWFYVGGGGNFEGGKKWKTINMPWSFEWCRTSILLKDGEWAHSHKGKGNRKDFYEDEWKEKQWKETHPYTYTLSNGKVQNVEATITVSEREWRQRWLMWTKLYNKERRSMDVEFNQEVGERTGSWKGGVIGCGQDLLPGESPLQCLRRMESERKFT